MPDKNTLGRQPLPPEKKEKKNLNDWYTNTAHSYAEESAEEAAGGDKPAPLDECYLHNATGSTSYEQTFRPAQRSIAG